MSKLEKFFIKEYTELQKKYEEACEVIEESTNDGYGICETGRNVDTIYVDVCSAYYLGLDESPFKDLAPNLLRDIATDTELLELWSTKKVYYGSQAIDVRRKVWAYEFKVYDTKGTKTFLLDDDTCTIRTADRNLVSLGEYLYPYHKDEIMQIAYEELSKQISELATRKEKELEKELEKDLVD